MLRLLLCLSLLCSGRLTAQNDFQLFRPGVQYLYENMVYKGSNPFLIESQYYGLRVDSLGCEELYTTLGGYANEPSVFTCEVSFAFGDSVCQTADSTVFHYRLSGAFVLYQQAGVGERWVAFRDAGVDIVAEVVSVDTATVLGLPDSVKRIRFYTEEEAAVGLEALISKRYGLVRGQRFDQILFENFAYELAGMDGPVAGVQLPEPESYSLAAVGDTFQIESYNYLPKPFGSPTPNTRRYSSFTILEVDSSRAEVYGYRARGDFYDYNAGAADTLTGYRAVALDTTFEFTAERLPARLRGVQPGQAILAEGQDSSRLAMVSLFKDSCGLLRIRASTPVTIQQGEQCGLDDSQVDGGPGPVYTQEVPVTLDSLSGQSGFQWAGLRYLSSGDRQCGTFVDPTDLRVSVREMLYNFTMQLYPNPVRDQLTVELLEGGQQYSLQILSMTGARLLTVPNVRQSATIPTADLPEGTYLLLITQGGRPVGRRVFVRAW